MSTLADHFPFVKNTMPEQSSCISTRLRLLLSEFGFTPKLVIPKFKATGAYLGGSASLYLIRKYTANFQPGDLDIFINPHSTTMADIKRLVGAFGKAGYSLDKNETITALSAVISIDDEEDADNGSQTYGDNLLNNHVQEVWTFRHASLGKKIQIVLVNIDPRIYICKHTDLSCTAIAIRIDYYIYPIMNPQQLYALKQNKMYVMSDYQSISGGYRLKKLSGRISKYEERGFTLADEPSVTCPDTRLHTQTKLESAFDIMTTDNTTVHEALQTYNNVIVYINGSSANVVDRQEFYSYCALKGRSYWNHDLSYVNDADMEKLLKEEYSIYTITALHGSNGLYRLHAYSVADFYRVRENIAW